MTTTTLSAHTLEAFGIPTPDIADWIILFGLEEVELTHAVLARAYEAGIDLTTILITPEAQWWDSMVRRHGPAIGYTARIDALRERVDAARTSALDRSMAGEITAEEAEREAHGAWLEALPERLALERELLALTGTGLTERLYYYPRVREIVRRREWGVYADLLGRAIDLWRADRGDVTITITPDLLRDLHIYHREIDRWIDTFGERPVNLGNAALSRAYDMCLGLTGLVLAPAIDSERVTIRHLDRMERDVLRALQHRDWDEYRYLLSYALGLWRQSREQSWEQSREAP